MYPFLLFQGSLTEQAYKDILDKAGGPKNGLQPGYEQLGYSKAEAEECVAKLAEEERIAEEEAARIAAEKAEVGLGHPLIGLLIYWARPHRGG